jgi:hypothetical protein
VSLNVLIFNIDSLFYSIPVQIKNHVFSSIYRHGDETNARLVEGIRAKIKKSDWLQFSSGFTLLESGGIEVFCYSANRRNKRMPMR